MENQSVRPLSDAELDYLEEQIPDLAQAATRAAFLATLASGQSAVIAEDDAIFEVFPDGSRRFIKALEPLVPVGKTHG